MPLDFDRVVAATMESQSVSAADAPVFEVRCPSGAQIELIRIEIGAAEGTDPVDEVQEVVLYRGPNAGSGGTALAERTLRGAGTIRGSSFRNLTAPGSPSNEEIYFGSFHWRRGWLWLPVPDERPVLKTVLSTDPDNFGFYFPTAPDQATTFSATLVWGETG